MQRIDWQYLQIGLLFAILGEVSENALLPMVNEIGEFFCWALAMGFFVAFGWQARSRGSER